MSVSHLLLRRNEAVTTSFLRRFCTATAETSSENERQKMNHEFLPPNTLINSWKPPKNPKEAQYQLALLRREYDKQLKQIRKGYIHEMEIRRLEKLRKDEARKEALRLAKEANDAVKAARKLAKSQQRKLDVDDSREIRLKAKAEKLEYWREREKKFEERKKAERELIRRKSSMWIGETDLEKKLLENVIETTSI